MQVKKLHSWNLSYSQAIALQKRFACEVEFAALKERPKLIAGLVLAPFYLLQQLRFFFKIKNTSSIAVHYWFDYL